MTTSDSRTVEGLRIPRPWLAPFVATDPITDLCIGLGALPLWWILGIEQVVWPFLTLFIAAKVVTLRRAVPTHSLLILLFGFVAVQGISALFIVETERYATFLRNASTYVAAWFVVLIVLASVRTWSDASRVLNAVLFSFAAASALGLVAASGLLRPTFMSPFGTILPQWIAATDFGSSIAQRSVGWTSWFAGFGEYFRLRSLFLWPTTYAPALVMGIPLAYLFFRHSHGRLSRLVYGLAMAMMAVNLLFTTGRMATAGLIVGGAYWFFVRNRRNGLLHRAIVLVGAGAILAGAAVVASDSVAPQTLVEEAFYARGSGSPTARARIYRATLDGVMERPIFGWGTERDIRVQGATYTYPAGSHSYPLGVLYKHGFVGFAVFVAIWVVLWRTTGRRPPGRVGVGRSREVADFFDVGRWILIAMLVTSTTTVLDLDATLLVYFFAIMACLAALARARPRDADPGDPNA